MHRAVGAEKDMFFSLGEEQYLQKTTQSSSFLDVLCGVFKLLMNEKQVWILDAVSGYSAGFDGG